MDEDTTTTTTVDETTTTTTEAPAEDTTTTTTEDQTTTTTTEDPDTTTTTTETTVEQHNTDEAGTENAVPADQEGEPTQPETPFDEQAHASANDLEVANPDNSPVLGHDRPSDPLENTNDAIAVGQAQAAHNAPKDQPQV